MFNNWASSHDIVKSFQACARELVKRRRARMLNDPARWERFAIAVVFTCRRDPCSSTLFHNRNTFRNHLKEQHHYPAGHKLEIIMEEGKNRWQYRDSEFGY